VIHLGKTSECLGTISPFHSVCRGEDSSFVGIVYDGPELLGDVLVQAFATSNSFVFFLAAFSSLFLLATSSSLLLLATSNSFVACLENTCIRGFWPVSACI